MCFYNIKSKCSKTLREKEARYHLIGHNLCHAEELLDILKERHDFDPNVPTLFVMECVQMYLPEERGRKLLEIISKTCSIPLIVLFDPILLNDMFGVVMERNLTKAGLIDTSTSLHHLRTLDSHLDRLIQCGFDLATGCDMAAAYESILTLAANESQ